jgi:hypothetical protein
VSTFAPDSQKMRRWSGDTFTHNWLCYRRETPCLGNWNLDWRCGSSSKVPDYKHRTMSSNPSTAKKERKRNESFTMGISQLDPSSNHYCVEE